MPDEQADDVRERQWGYVGWSTRLSILARYDESALRARQGIALDPGFDAIETVYGMGYRWLAD